MRRPEKEQPPVFSSEEEQAAFYREEAFSYLETSMRTECEVRNRLKEKQCPDALIGEITCMLAEYHYIDDAAYARAYVRQERTLHFRSRRDITMRLNGKGVDLVLIESAFDEEEEGTETDMAVHWIQKKTRNTRIDRSKLLGFLVRRGFSYGTIREAFAICGMHESDTLTGGSEDDFE